MFDLEWAVGYSRAASVGSEWEMRAACALRNAEWRGDGVEMLRRRPRVRPDGTRDGGRYREALRYDLVVPRYSLEAVLSSGDAFLLSRVEEAMSLCHVLLFYSSRWRSTMPSKRDKTPMPARFLESFAGRDYRRLLDGLVSLGVVVEDPFYQPGVFVGREGSGVCRHFAFSVERPEVCVFPLRGRVAVRRFYGVEGDGDVRYADGSSSTVRDASLNEWFSMRFRLSDDAVLHSEDDSYGFEYYYSNVLAGGELREAPAGQRLRRFTIGRDAFGTRLYHPFLNMNRALRRYVEIGGSTDTEEIDVRNSHPYFFSMLFSAGFLDGVSSVLTDAERRLFLSVAEDDGHRERVRMLQRIASSGSFYDFLSGEVVCPDVKLMSMYYFYGKLNRHNEIYRFFESHFPFVNMVKRSLIKMGGNKRLCQIMQRVEALVLIDGVFMPLMERGVDVLPLHDAFMFNRRDRGVVEEALLDAFVRFGVPVLPSFSGEESGRMVSEEFDDLKRSNFNVMLNKNFIYERLNQILRLAGVSSRVFKDGMSPESQAMLDSRFEEQRHLLPDDLQDEYVGLRMALDSSKFDLIDFSPYFDGYDCCQATKRRYSYGGSYDLVKLNPIEYLNYSLGFDQKTRVNEKKYVY